MVNVLELHESFRRDSPMCEDSIHRTVRNLQNKLELGYRRLHNQLISIVFRYSESLPMSAKVENFDLNEKGSFIF